ncbi:hypothetical protein [Allorhizocola rhizosphaerae]|uniref:hypothetical protein n=1 Tax=Allorhizocola rhizosphaerae TaxID=1872709 RepID=UPI000E3B6DDC|nr:hypothetical protein [Allorhizocola rhizosphaerae]
MSIRKLEGTEAGSGSVVVVTAFQCRSRLDLLLIWWMHHRLKSAVRAAAPDFLGIRLYIDWRRRIARSVSLWAKGTGLYDMGNVKEHIAATRFPGTRGIETSCGVYTYGGDWRSVMFGDGFASRPPLQKTKGEYRGAAN